MKVIKLLPGCIAKFCRSYSSASMSKSESHVPDEIKPLAWLLGKWEAKQNGKGRYPTIKDFEYGEQAEFFTFGKPIIQFSFYSSHPVSKQPMHREVGFIRIKPGTNQIAFVSAHNIGVTDLKEGEVSGTQLKVETKGMQRMAFSKEPETKKLVQTFHRQGDELEHVMFMETSNTPLTEHLRITYKKVE